MIAYNTAVILAGTSLLGVCSGLVGSFAVLRGRALTGDALAHAALPGLCLAFLVVGHRSLPAMLFGAFLSGLAGIAAISALRFTTRVKEDAAIGIVLSVFFGAGIVLSGMIQKLWTGGSKAGLDSYIFGKTAGMIVEDVYLIGGVAAGCLLLMVLLYKEFKVVAFDTGFASAQGWPAFRLDLLLMAMIAVTVVIGLPAVGVVLMAALLIIPAAAARFWTDRLETMLVLSALFGLVIGAVGTLASSQYSRLPAGPVIVLVGTALFVASLLFAPRRGVAAKLLSERRFRAKIAEQRVLRALYEWHEGDIGVAGSEQSDGPAARAPGLRNGSDPATRRKASDAADRAALARLQRAGYVVAQAESTYALTGAGWKRAAEVTRAQRLWELFLTEHADAAGNFADLDSESLDDALPRELVEELEAALRMAGRLPEV